MGRIILLLLLALTAACAPTGDRMQKVPGYPDDFKPAVYSGYFDIKNQNRSSHYVFVESANGPASKDPVTLWLNGGPGCSSMLGFIQEIGPFYIPDGADYKVGDNLTENKQSWHKISNLLFLESPAGVGFSFNLDKDFQYNDVQTAHDSLNAVLSFYQKFPQYKDRGLWIAGQSYAGVYIPQLAQLIIKSNDFNNTKIRLIGILIGNGLMSFDFLHSASIEYMIARNFVDPQTVQYWRSSCQTDPQSAGCRFFQQRFIQDTKQINPYNVYDVCYYNGTFLQRESEAIESQTSILQKLKKKFYQKLQQVQSPQDVKSLIYSNKKKQSKQSQPIIQNSPQPAFQKSEEMLGNAPCMYFWGVFNYFNSHAKEYKAQFPDMKWNGPCARNITYHVNPRGSLQAFRFLLSRENNRSQIVLYNGNWDVVIPYTDTIKNIRALNLKPAYIYQPWFTGNQHAGFVQLYSGLLFLTVKGASHMVPQSKRQAGLQIFNDTLRGHPSFGHLSQEIRVKFTTE